MLEKLREELEKWDQLKLTRGELRYLESLELFSPGFLDYLAEFRFNLDQINISKDDEDRISVTIEGPWLETILWEVPVLATLSELYFSHEEKDWKKPDTNEQFYKKTYEKAQVLIRGGCNFSDFGTRRRRSRALQKIALKACKDADQDSGSKSGRGSFTGTSNVAFAKQLRLKPIGTIAHEWFMAHSKFSGVENANRDALLRWLQTFNGNLSVALSDTYTTPLFLKNFDRVLAEEFSGVRQDSGDPKCFVNQLIEFYQDHSINPQDKTLVFSDGLNPEKAVDLEQYVDSTAQTAYGIGTNLTNDIPDSPPLNITLKLVAIDGESVCKLTDDPEKQVGSEEEILELQEKVQKYIGKKNTFTHS